MGEGGQGRLGGLVVRAVPVEAVAVVAVAEPAVAVGRSAVAVAHRVPRRQRN